MLVRAHKMRFHSFHLPWFCQPRAQPVHTGEKTLKIEMGGYGVCICIALRERQRWRKKRRRTGKELCGSLTPLGGKNSDNIQAIEQGHFSFQMTHCEGSTHRSADWTPLAKQAAVDCFIKLQQWPIECERKRVTEGVREYISIAEKWMILMKSILRIFFKSMLNHIF